MRRPNQICIHEAAHAVMAFCLGQRVNRLTWNGKTDGKQGQGFTWISYRSPARRIISHRRTDPVVLAIIIMAGYMAEVEWCGWNQKLVPASDWRELEKRHITWQGRNTLKPTLRKWMRAEKAAIFAVARALEAKKHLSRRQFLAVLKALPKRRRKGK